MTSYLSEVHFDVLATLTRRVRVMTLGQVEQQYRLNACQEAGQLIESLEANDYVRSVEAIAHPELAITHPVFTFRPGQEVPTFPKLSRQLRNRWTQVPAPVRFVYATSKARALVGGFIADSPPKRTALTHDIHLAAVFLLLRKERPGIAKRWVSDDEQYFHGGGRWRRLPDAVIRGRKRPVDLIIEFGGSYSSAKLQAMHEDFCSVPYEIW